MHTFVARSKKAGISARAAYMAIAMLVLSALNRQPRRTAW